MADNFIKNNNWDIKFPTKTIQKTQQVASGLASGLWEPLFNFIDENQNVFQGNVANEIEKYNLAMINVGAALRERTNGITLNLMG